MAQPTSTGVATNGDCTLHFETFGSPADPTLLLVNGLGSQCINYDAEWCAMFAAEGLHVVRFDNRDVGLSTHFTDAPVDDSGAAYRLADMADDAVAVLDALGVPRAHAMGVSMGGMIVQQLAIDHADRVASITSVMSRTGNPDFGASTPEAFALLTAEPATDRASAVERAWAGHQVWGSPDHLDRERHGERVAEAFDRAFDPSGVGRQYLAVRASGSREDRLRHVNTPTLVLHGTADTLIDISGGQRTAEIIPGARFVAFEGMGHDYPPAFWRTWVDEVIGFIRSL